MADKIRQIGKGTRDVPPPAERTQDEPQTEAPQYAAEMDDQTVDRVQEEEEEEVPEETSGEFDGPRPPLVDGRPTINGVPVPESLPLPFKYTDQGRWDANAHKPKRSGPRIEMGKDADWEQKLDRRADMPWAESDPFQEAVRHHETPGFTHRMLSDHVCSKRGMRGWEVVKDGKGDPVRVNKLFLGRMPKDLATKRNEHYRRRGNEALHTAHEQMQMEHEKAIRDAGGQGISVLRRGEHFVDSRDPDREGTVGFHQVRGRAA